MKVTTKKIVSATLLVAMAALIAVPMAAGAQTNAENLFDLPSGNFGLGNEPLKSSINKIIGVLLGFLGILAVIIILWGGFIWMTAMGDEDKVAKAKQLIIAGIVGIIIILSAYAIAQFVISNIGAATGT